MRPQQHATGIPPVQQPLATLLPQEPPPLEDVWVSLDVETTGLSAETDEIIEVGAVKFLGERTIDTFQSVVNPHTRLSQFIKRYTGITQEDVDGAPSFSSVAPGLVSFVGAVPIVGHNVGFDLGFLTAQGLRLTNPRSDTWDLAFVLLPESREYSLDRLAASLGISHPQPHRALYDARATMELFLKLAEMAREMDVNTLAEMERLASSSSWVLTYLLRRLGDDKTAAATAPSPPQQALAPAAEPPSQVGIMGFDVQSLRQRFKHARALRPNRDAHEVDVGEVVALLQNGGPLARAMPGFEERSEQLAMAEAVAEAINGQRRLIVEAGTGVGKSLAYLLPAVLYALKNNKRVVVSTNTINLQEQLLSKDVPTLVDALREAAHEGVEDFQYSQLKGRANYLCLKRWLHLRSADSLSEDEARLLSKILVWMGGTKTGDRSELNLSAGRPASPWGRLSAEGALDCSGVYGVCFLRAARDRAAAAHLVIVNHSLLMSDLVAGRALVPDYDILIIDEAHHLEEQATRLLGFELAYRGFDDHLQSLVGLLNRMTTAFRAASIADTRRSTVEEVAARITALTPTLRDAFAGLMATLGGVIDERTEGGSFAAQEKRITSSTRSQPGWSDLEVQWENVDVAIAELQRQIAALSTSLDGLDEAALVDYDGMVIEASNALQRNEELRQRLREFIPQPSPDGIYWVTRGDRPGDLSMHAAPLHVGQQLEELLFQQKESVILTSATLSADETFDHVRERTGFSDAEELLLGSPFDYPRAALLCVPEDMPEPRSWAYQTAIEEAITDATVAAEGRTMALFTSHASLRSVAAAIRGTVEARGFDVLAQGIDGTPHQVLRNFLENPRSVLLGTASFWEGVDLAGESLKVLLLARLPFSVPSEPVFEARSELYEDSFNQYAVPQAILRIRQGFGRLIRTKTDKGVVVILDRRITSRKYGKAFLRSLPPVAFKTPRLYQLPDAIKGWLQG